MFVTAVLGFAFMHERSAVNDRRSTLDGLQTQVAQNQAAKASSAAAAAATQAQITAITSAATGRIAWDDLLNQLSRVMPSGASLVSLQASDGNGTSPASTPTSFVVTGNAVSQATVAQVLDRLALIPALSDVSLQSTQRADAAGTTTTAAPNTNAVPTNAVPTNAVQFTIGATLRSAGGTPQ